MDYKIPLFALLTRFAYKMNVEKNDFLIVQQEWMRQGMSRLLQIPENRFVVFPPQRDITNYISTPNSENKVTTFLFPATADCHKNFEVLCHATQLLEELVGQNKFRTLITVSGNENRYARYLKQRWGYVKSLYFIGFQKRETLFSFYTQAHCLVFPSKVETWGLPISEFAHSGKPMLLANLPYAWETAAGCKAAAFFHPDDAKALAKLMLNVYENNMSSFSRIAPVEIRHPHVYSWEQLFEEIIVTQGQGSLSQAKTRH